jgi:hypothetical protein
MITFSITRVPSNHDSNDSMTRTFHCLFFVLKIPLATVSGHAKGLLGFNSTPTLESKTFRNISTATIHVFFLCIYLQMYNINILYLISFNPFTPSSAFEQSCRYTLGGMCWQGSKMLLQHSDFVSKKNKESSLTH